MPAAAISAFGSSARAAALAAARAAGLMSGSKSSMSREAAVQIDTTRRRGVASRAGFGAAPRSHVRLCTGRVDPAA